MCDTMVAVPPRGSNEPILFAKNSDREPGEAQVVEHHLPASHAGAALRCTWIEIPGISKTSEMVLSRPAWMWGAEMGANIHGLAIGNEAVFTRVPVERSGLTGMDLLRLALERCHAAREALDLITTLIRAHGQGGRMGYRNKGFRYHSAFMLADPSEAWILETAGRFWAAKRVEGVATISNVLSIEDDFDLISDDAVSHARERGWCTAAKDFGFARCYGDRLYRFLAGGEQRRACTLQRLGGTGGRPDLEAMKAALRSHGGKSPTAGWRMENPCAHASWLPTRHAGQTTGSMVSRLSRKGSMHWLTGTSSPCLSVFKPVVLGLGEVDTGPAPSPGGFDPDSLFWRHEVLHRRVLVDYERRRELFDEERLALESRGRGRPAIDEAKGTPAKSGSRAHEGAVEPPTPEGRPRASQCPSAEAASELWEEHRALLPEWSKRVLLGRGGGLGPLASVWWRRQSRLDGVPH